MEPIYTQAKTHTTEENREEKKEEFRFSDITDHGLDFIKTKIAYYKLAAIEGAANAVAGAVTGILLFLLGLFFLIFLSTAAALAIGSALGAAYWGFFVVAGFYMLLVAFVLVAQKKLIKTPIINLIIQKLNGGDENGKQERDQ